MIVNCVNKNIENYQKQKLPKTKIIQNNSRKLCHKKDPRKRMVLAAKNRAKKHNLEFNITKEDIIIPKYCPILNIPIFIKSGGKGPIDNSPSLDRINPKLGYVKGNVAIISSKANRMKQNSTIENLEKIIFYINGFKIEYPII